MNIKKIIKLIENKNIEILLKYFYDITYTRFGINIMGDLIKCGLSNNYIKKYFSFDHKYENFYIYKYYKNSITIIIVSEKEL